MHTLRKGHSSVYLQYEHDGDSMGAEKFEAGVSDGVLAFRFALRPVDGNQRTDEERLHSQELQSVQITDEYVIDKLSDLFSLYSREISEMRLIILSKGRSLSYNVVPGAAGVIL